jgi:hypothetical protein
MPNESSKYSNHLEPVSTPKALSVSVSRRLMHSVHPLLPQLEDIPDSTPGPCIPLVKYRMSRDAPMTVHHPWPADLHQAPI